MPEKSESVIAFQCPLCDWNTGVLCAVSQHIRWHHPGMKHCPKCKEVMPSDLLKAHVSLHALDLVECPHCNRGFGKKQIGGHIAMMHVFTQGQKEKMHGRAMENRGKNKEYRQGLSARMKKRNPMNRQGAREKMTATIQRMVENGELVPYGNRGVYGNGKEPTVAESALIRILKNAKYQHVVSLRDGERPYHYKIDFAFEKTRIAVEVDGSSHSANYRKMADARKEMRLAKLGWEIIRITNSQALGSGEDSERVRLSLLEKDNTEAISMT